MTNNEIKVNDKFNRVTFVGIGILLFLTINTLSHFLEELIYDLALTFSLKPILILWSQLSVRIIVYTVGLIIGINIIKSTSKSNRTIFWYLFGLLLLFTILGLLPYIFQDSLRTDKVNELINKTREYADNSHSQVLIISVLGLLPYLIVGFIIFTKKKDKNSG
jgi:phosphoglycerol transferase MdoB-like AlkP superfamily enzyme